MICVISFGIGFTLLRSKNNIRRLRGYIGQKQSSCSCFGHIIYPVIESIGFKRKTVRLWSKKNKKKQQAYILLNIITQPQARTQA